MGFQYKYKNSLSKKIQKVIKLIQIMSKKLRLYVKKPENKLMR